MVENIKKIIAEASQELFNAHGYQKVTMRQIADRCGISVGNLTYHYPHKEDLLMLEHDGILNAFLEKVRRESPDLKGLAGYVTVECAFLYHILIDPVLSPLYADVINVPNLRRRYYEAHYQLYLSFCPEAEGEPARESTIAMSAMEYAMSDTQSSLRFADTMLNIFRAKLLIEGKDPVSCSGILQSAILQGIELAEKLGQDGC